MPHISKGGKYISGWSKVESDGSVVIPEEAFQEYHLEPDERVIRISGSKASGGFVVAKKRLLEQSALSGVLLENPLLASFQIEEGETIRFKGRQYCWATVRENRRITLPSRTMSAYEISPRDFLLSIRGSNIAFVLALKGPIVEKAKQHPEIAVFD
jgi:bifunctional DNA-binding transcriptional regulator/antitoxin component of YhaV-PrlF toxin-antitoxin module